MRNTNNKGANTIGVDASSFMTKLSEKRKVKSVNSIFNYNESKKIKKDLINLIL